jgi:hypothetical protein
VVNNAAVENIRFQTLRQISSKVSCRANLNSDSRRIDLKKLATTAIGQVFGDAKSKCSRINLLLEPKSALSEAFDQHFGRDVELKSHASKFSHLGDILARDSGVFCIGVFGNSRIPKNPALYSLAKNLGRFHAVSQKKLLTDLTDHYRAQEVKSRTRHRGDYADIVVQEKPGKLSVMDLQGPTLRANNKSWRSVAMGSYNDVKSPLCISDGWGAFTTTFQKIDSHNREGLGNINIAVADVNMEPYQFHLELPMLMVDLALTWFLKTAETELTGTSSIEILCPYIAVVSALWDAFSRRLGKAEANTLLSHEHLLLGWNPLISTLELMTSGSGPSLVLELSNFPRMNLMAIWT